MRRSLGLALFALIAIDPRSARAAAPEGAADPPVGVALAAGAATTLIPLALGAMHTANATTYASRNVGFWVAGAGFALAPVVAHVVVGEYARAAAFGALPLAVDAGVIALTSVNPDAIFAATKGSRTAFGIFFGAGVFGATLGLIDVAFARDRARDRDRARRPRPLRGLTFSPAVGRGGAGIVIGGEL